MFIVIYRPHNELNIDTRHYGPFDSEAEAYDFLCDCLPAIGIQPDPTDGINNPGVKYVARLDAPQWTGVHA